MSQNVGCVIIAIGITGTQLPLQDRWMLGFSFRLIGLLYKGPPPHKMFKIS